MNRMWRSAELGITPRIRRKLDRQKIRCGDGDTTKGWLINQAGFLPGGLELTITSSKMAGFGEKKGDKTKKKKDTAQTKEPISGINLHKEALNCHAKGDLANAEKKYRLAIDTGYLAYDIFLNLGVICRNSRREEESIYLYKRAIKINPHNPDAYFNLGNIYRDLGKLDQALASFQKSIELKPDSPNAHLNLGGIHKDFGNLDQALASTLKSLELNPKNPDALRNLGGIYKDLGNLDQALASTLKSLELNPKNPDALMNLGGIYKDLGNLDQALASTMKSLELNPDNSTAYENLGNTYQDLGNLDQAIACLKKAVEIDKSNKNVAIKLAKIYCHTENHEDGLKAIEGMHEKEAENMRLAMYLCQNKRLKFIPQANSLIAKGLLNQQGIAAIDHGNILYNLTLDNGLNGDTLDAILTQSINNREYPDILIQELLDHLTSESIQPRNQGLLVNGLQTSGNILDHPGEPIKSLKKLLITKIDEYNKSFDINTDKDFYTNWKQNLYVLKGWAIVMKKGGNLKPHNHETGWLTGTFYLQMPHKISNTKEGAIEFSHQGPKYPSGNSIFKRKIMRPSARDLNIFPSSLFHRTLPFQSDEQRICIAFDITKKDK